MPYTKAVDVYSFGRIVGVMLLFCPPCADQAALQLRQSEEATRDVCTRRAAFQRPTPTELLRRRCFVGLGARVRAQCRRLEAVASTPIPWVDGPVLNLRRRQD